MAVTAESMSALPANVRASTRPIVVYEQAVYAIRACSTILEAQHWNDKAEALAAWSKIYADERVEQEARSLKLHAYRQIGRLADQMRQCEPRGKGYRKVGGSTKGARSLLMEHGIGAAKAQQMITIARVPDVRFQSFVNRPKPPSPSVLTSQELRPNPAWSKFSNRLSIFLSCARRTDSDDLVVGLDKKQIESAKTMAKEAMDFLGDLQERLWKVAHHEVQTNGTGSVDKGESITTPR
jgi:hypothetical protein